MAEKYDSTKHYPLVLQAAKDAHEIAICPIAKHLDNNGVIWPNLNYDNAPHIWDLDRDIRRAWRECGYTLE